MGVEIVQPCTRCRKHTARATYRPWDGELPEVILCPYCKNEDDDQNTNREGGVMSAICTWTLDRKIEAWRTDCGSTFQFNQDGPHENGFNFCPYCSCEIVAKEKGDEQE